MAEPRREQSLRQFDMSAACERLARSLESLCAVYEELERLALQRREAIRGVDHRGLHRVLESERAVASRLVVANQERGDAVRVIEGEIGRPEQGMTTVRWIVEQLGELSCARSLGEVAERLRGLIAISQKRLASDRLATDKVVAHIRGILHAATERLNHAGTYGQRGTLETRGGQIISAMDVTS